MIGNDIVDLALAKKESNWQRNRFLDKIFTENEQLLIANATNPEMMVWNLWTRKEAAYKIYNRETGIRGYIPWQLDCFYENENLGTVSCNGLTYHTQTQISNESIYTIAVAKKQDFNQIRKIDLETKISKINGIPFVKDISSLIVSPVSITHHGRFWEGIMLVD
ncbi:Phosphopantetheinyl transferase (holo-ACP synthase) [Flavobacterium fryxellicola]|uniref:Phosphopantetheinyl transferase n=1 Tax=Flavobacterium fryxellicola TaxID=249352 RepID=A0A167YL03_9FLAO|nr:4'-phosphopantetheinyl transferase superfamily protein [Flavobacterium fryxellicola]OAB29534.1 phosphopantetheinyl transferase [Flavobacterium fryxellicola]SHN71457.1 Phosphopantetheinyl transferase (holo-ACP synthase) [Flavobacterium fryxellicola]